MIYIYDDRAIRREENQKKLTGFEDHVKFEVVNIIPGKSVEECIIDPIEDSECIIFHKSYALGDENVTFETIRQLFASLDIPIVIFSGGTEGSNKSDREININADLMYENLPFFLENFRKNGKINIDTLLWGRRFRLNSILQFQNEIAESYFINNNLDEDVKNISEIKRVIRNLSRKTNNKELGETILYDIDNIESLTWLGLLNIVENNIKKIK